jgi:protein-tyrosine-phosphatase
MFFLKPRVLFLSSGDPLRSLLAAGLLRQHVGRRFRAFSAAVRDLGPDAGETLKALGVDTRLPPAEDLAQVAARRFDYVITVAPGTGVNQASGRQAGGCGWPDAYDEAGPPNSS